MARGKFVFAAVLAALLPGQSRAVWGQAASLASSSSLSLPLDPAASARAYVALPPKPQKPRSSLSRWSMNLKGGTLGAGAEISADLGRHIGLRGSVNSLEFHYPFSIDGVTYDSDFYLRSGGLSVDWFLTHRGIRISPGVLYVRNNLSAISGVPPGRYFELGSEGFINSVDDPLNGTAAVIFPRKIAPMLTLGFDSLLPSKGEGRRLSFPMEIGAAYTGAAQIDVTLNGTACTYEGCFTFAENAEAQDSLKAEIAKLNNRLAKFPVYPIFSMGMAYRF